MKRHPAFRFAAWAALVPLTLAACGGDITSTATATIAVTPASASMIVPSPSAPTPDVQSIPARSPDRTIGTDTDGWVLDRIEPARSGMFTTMTIRFVPSKDATAIPQTNGWYEASSAAYILTFRGVRGSNLVLRPNQVQPLALPPLTGYYALRVMDDTTLAIAITCQHVPQADWSLAADTIPGAVRFSVEFT